MSYSHPFSRFAESYEMLRRGVKLEMLDLEVFTAMLVKGDMFRQMLERVGMQKRYDAYRMVLGRMLDGEELVCYEDELADELLGVLAEIDKQIRFDAAYGDFDKRVPFADMATVFMPADRMNVAGGWR